MESATIDLIVQLVTLTVIISFLVTAVLGARRWITMENGRRYAHVISMPEHTRREWDLSGHRPRGGAVLIDTSLRNPDDARRGQTAIRYEERVTKELERITSGYSTKRRELMERTYQDTLTQQLAASKQISSMQNFSDELHAQHENYLRAVDEIRSQHDPHRIQQQIDAAHAENQLPSSTEQLRKD